MDPDGNQSIEGSCALAEDLTLVETATTSEVATSSVSTIGKLGILGFIFAFCLCLQGDSIPPKDNGVKIALPPGYTMADNGVISGPNGTLATSSAAWDEYNGNDTYISNPKHHQNAKGKASKEPQDAESMFKHSVRDPDSQNHPYTRWYKDKKGNIHRFQGSKQGNTIVYHWNGSTEQGIRKEDVPNEFRKNLKNGDY